MSGKAGIPRRWVVRRKTLGNSPRSSTLKLTLKWHKQTFINSHMTCHGLCGYQHSGSFLLISAEAFLLQQNSGCRQ